MKRSSAVLFIALFVLLAALRLPSLAQPAGNDQGLYAYVGQAIARGEVPYRDAWDQKPPAIHLAYAAMYWLWPHDSVVAATDLAAAIFAALLLVAIGRRLAGRPGPGEIAALLLLLLGNPSFQRMGGMYVRGQCETFIAVLVPAALLLVMTATAERESGDRVPRAMPLVAAGVLLGLAFLFKYTAGMYAVAAIVTAALFLPAAQRGASKIGRVVRAGAALALGMIVPIALVAAWIAHAGAMRDLLDATVRYNVGYSGETYGSVWRFAWYLITFPVRHAAVDSLWLLGGAGCVLLLVAGIGSRRLLAVPVSIAAACVAIAVNGGRGLPQYFVQALPLLALAAGLAIAYAWNSLALVARLALVAVLAVAVVRVAPFDKLAATTWRDVQHIRGNLPAEQYLAEFTSARTSAAAVEQLGEFLRTRTSPSERVFVFGFSGGAYVRAQRASASRFFWSRPILVGFNEGLPGYGATALLNDLAAAHPAFVVLQLHDWPAEGTDSATYFLGHARLNEWLRSRYEMTTQNGSYLIWRRRVGA